VIVVTGTVDGIESAGSSGSHENSVIHGIAEIIVDSISAREAWGVVWGA
jgi:hypothetical protein